MSVFLSACASAPFTAREYYNGSSGSIKTFIAKPEFDGQRKSAFYISGDYANATLEHSENDMPNSSGIDDRKSLSLNVHRAVTLKHLNYYYGLGGTYGRYKFNDLFVNEMGLDSDQGFYVLNLRAGINYLWSTPTVDFRFIGLDLTQGFEGGDYVNSLDQLRQWTAGQNGVDKLNVYNQRSMFSGNLNSELTVKFNVRKALTAGMFLGTPLFVDSNNPELKGVFYGGFLSYRYQRFNFNIIEERSANVGEIGSAKFGLSYCLF